MPTIGIYVPMPIARTIAQRWKITVDDEDFQELVRSLIAEALDDHAGIRHPDQPFQQNCQYARIHRAGYHCRHCNGN